MYCQRIVSLKALAQPTKLDDERAEDTETDGDKNADFQLEATISFAHLTSPRYVTARSRNPESADQPKPEAPPKSLQSKYDPHVGRQFGRRHEMRSSCRGSQPRW